MAQTEKSIALPSGKVALMRPGKGRDWIRAHNAVAGEVGNPNAVTMALVAQLTKIDGKPIVYEDLLGMDVDDVLILQAELMGINAFFRKAAELEKAKAAEAAAAPEPAPEPEPSESRHGRHLRAS